MSTSPLLLTEFMAVNLASTVTGPSDISMSSIDPTTVSVTQWLFPPAQLRHTPTQQPSPSHTSGHADDSWTFEDEYRKRREAIQFLSAVEKDLQLHNPVKAQVDGWKAQQKSRNGAAGPGMMGMPQGGMMGMQMGMNGMSGMQGMGMQGMGMPYGRPNQMGMGMQQHGRYGQTSNGHGGIDQQVNYDGMPVKELLAYSGTFGHPNSAEFLHWINVNEEYEHV
jgi:hypothetical protein